MRFENLTSAIITHLEDAGLLVGDGVAPEGSGWAGTAGQSNYNAYCVVHPLLGGHEDGSLGEPHSDAQVVYQVSSFGPTREQAEIVASNVDATLKSLPYPSVVGMSIRYVDDDVLGGARRQDELQPPDWIAVPRFRFYVTAS